MSIILALGCESRVGVSYTGPKPFIIRCDKPGKLVRSALHPFGTWMCSDHEVQWKTRPTTG